MIKKYGRLWSITAASVVFLIILTSFYVVLPAKSLEAPGISDTDRPISESLSEGIPPLDKPPELPQPDGTDGQVEDPFQLAATESDQDEATPTDADPNATNRTSNSSTADSIPKEPSKIIVAGRLKTEDVQWIFDDLGDWQNAIYSVDLLPNETSPTGLKTKMNKAREAMPYLTYMVDNYPDFPDVVAFIHPHRNGMPTAWHTDAVGHDGVNMMRGLELEYVLKRGYVNLRCNNEVGCPSEIQPFRDPPDPNLYTEHAYPHIYGYFFNRTMEQMRQEIPVIAQPCCAQFAVSREQLLKRPKSDYEKYKKYLEETEYDDATSGRVMEYMWHIIFGREPVACDNLFECYCNVYGKCSRIWQRSGFNF